MSLAIIQIENVGLSVFLHFAVDYNKTIAIIRGDGQFSTNHLEVNLPFIANVVGAIIDHV